MCVLQLRWCNLHPNNDDVLIIQLFDRWFQNIVFENVYVHHWQITATKRMAQLITMRAVSTC